MMALKENSGHHQVSKIYSLGITDVYGKLTTNTDVEIFYAINENLDLLVRLDEKLKAQQRHQYLNSCCDISPKQWPN